jgi:hypothetical protein
MTHCPGCSCAKQAPDYPIECPKCGITYGPGGAVASHNPGGEFCFKRSLDTQSNKDYTTQIRDYAVGSE